MDESGGQVNESGGQVGWKSCRGEGVFGGGWGEGGSVSENI